MEYAYLQLGQDKQAKAVVASGDELRGQDDHVGIRRAERRQDLRIGPEDGVGSEVIPEIIGRIANK